MCKVGLGVFIQDVFFLCAFIYRMYVCIVYRVCCVFVRAVLYSVLFYTGCSLCGGVLNLHAY